MHVLVELLEMESQVQQLEMEFAMIRTTMQTAITMVNLQIVQIQTILQEGCVLTKQNKTAGEISPTLGL